LRRHHGASKAVFGALLLLLLLLPLSSPVAASVTVAWRAHVLRLCVCVWLSCTVGCECMVGCWLTGCSHSKIAYNFTAWQSLVSPWPRLAMYVCTSHAAHIQMSASSQAQRLSLCLNCTQAGLGECIPSASLPPLYLLYMCMHTAAAIPNA
jgi:hypothetical protein